MNKSETSLGSRIFPWTKVRWKPHSFVGRVDFFKSLYTIPRGVMFRPPLHTLDRQDPVLSVFKNGYMSLTLANNKNRNNLVRTSDWDKKTLKLKPVGGTPLRRQAGLLSHFGDGLRDQWRSCPRMMLALNKEMQRLISQGIDPIYTIGVPKIKNLLEMERDYLKGIENDY